MKRLHAALVAVAVGTGPSVAEEITLDYEAVMSIREVSSIGILGEPEQHVGVGRFRGLAIFPEETVILHRYEGWFDLMDGSGPFHGYAIWEFGDGAALRAAYHGKAQQRGPDDVGVEAEFHDFEGTGRFEGAKGTGEFAGRRLDSLEDVGATHVKGTLNLVLPD